MWHSYATMAKCCFGDRALVIVGPHPTRVVDRFGQDAKGIKRLLNEIEVEHQTADGAKAPASSLS